MKKITLLFLLLYSIAFAQWTTPPQPIVTGTGEQYPGFTITRNHSVIDGAGNVITIFSNQADYRYIYAQKTDNEGHILWDTGGKLVYTGAYTYTRGATVYNSFTQNSDTQIVSDGVGGAIISFTGTDYNYEYSTSFTPNVLSAIRIDADGNQVWSSRCVVSNVSASNGIAEEHMVIPDGNGGAYFGWLSRVYTTVNAPSNFKLFFQHVNADGSRQFAEDVLVKDLSLIGTPGAGLTIYPTLALLSSGEVLITWNDMFSGSVTLFANKINQEGNLQWTDGGVVVDSNLNASGPDMSSYCSPACAVVNGGVYLCYRTTASHKVSLLSNDGVPAFTPVILSAASGYSNSMYYDIAATATGEAIALYDFNGYPYAQKVNSTGEKLFGENGISIGADDCSTGYSGIYKKIIRTSQDKFLVAYSAGLNSAYRLKAHMFDANGNFSFPTGGTSLTYTYTGTNLNLLATNDGGGVLLFSSQNPPYSIDTFAAKIYPENNPVKIALHNGSNSTNIVTMQTTDNINYALSGYAITSDIGLFFRKDESVLINNALRSGVLVSNTICGTPFGTTGIPAGTYDVAFNRITKAYSFTTTLSANTPKITEIIFYPNPVSSVLHCSAQLESVKVFAIDGKQVAQQNNIYQVNVSHLPAGMYFARGLTTEGTEVRYKFLKE